MEQDKNSFLDAKSDIARKLNFKVQTHNRTTILLLASYIASFLTFVIFYLIFEHSPFIILTSLLLIFSATYIVNYIYVSRLEEVNTSVELQNDIFTAALREECDFYFILDSEGLVVYADPRFHEKLIKYATVPLNELDTILRFLEIRSPYKEEIINSIYESKQWHKTVQTSESASTTIQLKNFRLNNKRVGLSYTMNPPGFIVLKITYNKSYDNWNYLDELSVGLYELDKVGYIINHNDFFANTLGYTLEELNTEDLKLENFVITERKESNPLKTYGRSWQGTLQLLTRYDEQINIFLTQHPFFSESGELEKITGLIIKLPENSPLLYPQATSQNALEFSWESLFKYSPHPMAFIDGDGKFLKVNNEFIKTLPEADKDLTELCSEELKSLLKKEFVSISESSSFHPKKISNVVLGGLTVDIYLNKIEGSNANTVGFLVRISDKTNQQELEHSLSHIQRMQTIGHLVGSIAHDFNNILTAISGFCDLLFLRHTVGDPSFNHIMQIKQSTNRATNLVSRLLAFSRKQTLKPEPVNLNELFSDLASVISRLIGNHIELKQEIAHDVWQIQVDPLQLEQVILNLVVNAHHAMGENGILTIRTYNEVLNSPDSIEEEFIAPADVEKPEKGKYVAIEITDNGTGIDEKIIDKIFEPFFTTKAPNLGTGLGLSTVYGIIKQSGGYIYLKTRINKGTTFLLLFKSIQNEDKPLTQKQQAPKLSHPLDKDLSGQETIILVEDEDAVRSFAQTVLVSKGYKVHSFANPNLALEEINKGDIQADLVITDVVMPGMNGPNFIKEVSKVLSGFQVIFISGYGEDVFNKAYGSKRDFHFIPKPFSLKILISKVREVLGN